VSFVSVIVRYKIVRKTASGPWVHVAFKSSWTCRKWKLTCLWGLRLPFMNPTPRDLDLTRICLFLLCRISMHEPQGCFIITRIFLRKNKNTVFRKEKYICLKKKKLNYKIQRTYILFLSSSSFLSWYSN
jgi:hypothetical protein